MVTGCVGSGPLRRDSGADQCQMLPVTEPGPPVWSYQWFIVCGWHCWACVHVGRTKLHPKASFHQHWAWGRSEKVPKHAEICLHLPPLASTFWLHIKLSDWKSLCLYSAGYKLHRLGREGVPRVGLLLPPRLIHREGGCSIQERWHLWYGKMTHHRDPSNWPFGFLPRATNLRLSSHD